MKKRVVVLGAGISGLYTSLKLLEKGFEVTIIEKESYVGGLAASFNKNGFLIEYGPHTFHTVFDHLLEEYKKYTGEDFVSSKLDRQIKFMGKYYKYPPQFTDIIRQTSFSTSLSCFLTFSFSLIKRKLHLTKNDNAEEWLINNFGKTLYNIYFKDYTTKVWGLTPNKLSTTFVSQRIPTISIRQLFMEQFKKGMIKMRKGDHIYSPHVSHIFYSKKGSGKFCDEMLKKIIEKGGKIYYNSKIKNITILEKNANSVSFFSQNQNKIVSCDYLVSTIPLFDLINSIFPKPNTEKLDIVSKLKYRGVTVVAFIIGKNKVIQPQWIYFRDKIFNRLTEPKNYGLVTPSGKTVLYMETSQEGISDSDLIKKTEQELLVENFFKKEDIIDRHIISTNQGYPLFEVGFEKKFELIKEYLHQFENIYSTGRQGLFKYIDMDICMKMSEIVVDEISKNKPKQDVFVTKDEIAFI